MPRYLVMVQWGAGHRYPMGESFTAKDDRAALESTDLARVANLAREYANKRGAKPHGTLLRVVRDEVPELATFCSKCGKRLESEWWPPCKDCGYKTGTVRHQIEGTGPETPYLDLREED